MLKSFPFFFVVLPLVLVAMGVFLGVANARGFLALALGWLCGVLGVIAAAVYFEWSLWWLLLAIVPMLWLLPWAGAAASFAVPPPPGPSPAKQVHDTYKNLSPEQQEMVRRAATAVFKAGVRQGATHLREKGKTKLADGLEEIVR